MAVNPGVWGIDIGQCALKALRLEQINGVVTATAFDYVEHPKILSQPDANPDELTREALEKFLSRNPTKGDQVAMSVPGQSGLARFVKLPPVEEKKISDIVKFEAKQQIPFPLEEVVWDFQKVSEGTVTDGFAMDTEIGLFAMKRDMISRFIGHFQSVKLEVHHVQMAPLALTNYVTYDLLKRGGIDGEAAPQVVGKKKCIVALDIGTDGSNLIITDGGRIIWQRPIPVGGNHFTRALTKELKLTFAKAEHLKRNAAKSPELANILKALRPVLQEFVGEVQRSLGYFTNTHRDAQIEYMVGLGSAFKLPGLQKFLTDKLSLEVRKPDKFVRCSGQVVADAPVFKEHLLSFAVAYGLALQGLKVARLTTNLLPPEITFERKVRAKKPYAVAAAASLLLGTTVLAYGYSVPLAQVSDPKIEKSIKNADGVVSAAAGVDSQITAKKTEVEATQTEVESIIAGQSERINWVALNKFINESVPVPGPSDRKAAPVAGYHNMGGALERYWATVPGTRAVQKLQERISKGIDPLQSLTDDDMREYLATIDIEAIYGRYTKNLTGFYENIETKRRKDIDNRRRFPGAEYAPLEWWENKTDRPVGAGQAVPTTDVELKPQGEGWVIEVRGSTYWHPEATSETDRFIMDTLLQNIIARSRPLVEAKTDEQKKALAAESITGKISHVFLYNVWEDKNPSPGVFAHIKSSLLDPLVPAGGAAAADTGMGAPMGPAGVGPGPAPGSPFGGGAGNTTAGSSWIPLGSSAPAAGGGGGAAGPGGFGVPGPPGAGRAGDDAAPATSQPPKGIKVKPRFEFALIFTWKEPTPSDKLRKVTEKSTAPADGGMGIPGPGRGGAGGAPPPMGGGGKPKEDDL